MHTPAALRTLPALLLLLAWHPLTGCVEVPERPDARPPDAAPPEDAALPDVNACQAFEEICNSVDDDCDGAIDESDLSLCTVCEVPGGQGACAEGRTVCVDGAVECRRVGAPPMDGCDLVDGDCDGSWDEADEQPVPRDAYVAAQCWPIERGWGRAPDPGRCPEAGEVGCGPVHPCLDRACIAACDATFDADFGGCAADCVASADEAECRTGCRQLHEPTRQGCVAECPASLPDVERWACAPGDGGPSCEAVACAGRGILEDGTCRRDEICNNGIDEDNDGLVDGAVADPGACQAQFPMRPPTPIGSCPEGVPECDGVPLGHPLWSCGAGCPYAPTLNYDYALDREEVSNRAWMACVEAGGCTEPVGLAWRQTRVLFQFGGVPERPDAPGCADPVRLDPRVDAQIDSQVVDLPVTGVSWCQARAYCLWAGKRLPTEVEWERAASGLGPRRPWPWGSTAPASCLAAQCCGTEGERPPTCAEGPLEPCPDAPGGGPIRAACRATLGQADAECSPHTAACPDCLPGPTPTWANVDGQTPEGVLNLSGNVSEWTFDWASAGYGELSDFDPVGAACNELTAQGVPERLIGPGQRITRGGDFLRSGVPQSMLSRAPFPPGARLPGVGLRCARTLQSDEAGRPILCDPGRQGQPAVPGDMPIGPPCAAPDFDDDLGAAGRCPNDRRVPSRTCSEGQARLCATGRPLECGAWLVRRLAIDFGRLDELLTRVQAAVPGSPPFPRPRLDEVSIEFIGRLFDGDLLPNGGRTLIALETGCGFGGNDAFTSRLMNATQAAGGELVEMGIVDPLGECAPLATPAFQVVTQEPGLIDSTCTRGRGEVYIEGAGARLPYSGLMFFDAALDATRTGLSATLLYVISLADAADSTIGDDVQGALRDFLTGVGAPPFDLCLLQALGDALDTAANPLAEFEFGRWSCEPFRSWPGCMQGRCVGVDGDTSMCTGWLAPIRVASIAREATDLGLQACTCDGEPEPEPRPDAGP